MQNKMKNKREREREKGRREIKKKCHKMNERPFKLGMPDELRPECERARAPASLTLAAHHYLRIAEAT